MKTTPRLSKCKVCRGEYLKRSMTQVVCSPECGIIWAQTLKSKKRRVEYRQAKEKLKSRADWMKEAQQALNAWIRWRDRDLPCISCGRHHGGQYHAGHYLSRGARPNLALEPTNLAKQCQPCNVHLSGNLLLFRVGLIARIGLEAVEDLEADTTPRKYTIDQLKSIRDDYRTMLRDAKKNPAGAGLDCDGQQVS